MYLARVKVTVTMATPTKPLMSAKQSQAIRAKARSTAAVQHQKSLEAQKKAKEDRAKKAAAKTAPAGKKSADGGGDDAPDDGARLDAQKPAKKRGSKREG